MKRVRAEEVRDAMISKNITYVPHHECGGCNAIVFYSRTDDCLYFNAHCNCTGVYSPPQRREWGNAAQWINMQSNPETRQRLAALFGIENKATS